jgi:dephospho-CoA kinase
MHAEWEKQRKLNPQTAIVYDVPLLFESGHDRDFDIIILVYSTPEIQIQRIIDRDKVSFAEAEHTLAMQFPINSKKARSDYIIENSGNLEYTIRQVEEVWEKIREQASSRFQ